MIESILDGILSALPTPESNPSSDSILVPLLPQALSPSSPSSIRTHYETVESVISMATTSFLNKREDHNPGLDSGHVGLMGGYDIRHIIVLTILSIILYHLCEACIVQVEAEDIY